ncbi:hypothetical protein K523DRAFT_264285 [Schizophyllum commune Tattone D]|nr:hypothetical protein K523DRAFT_264285 [Schizophyllum commune Tattone D]
MYDDEGIPGHLRLPTMEGLFFPDGNIILQAESTIFRLYKGLLASKSTVFKDMFAFPQPNYEEKILFGCPVVEIYDNAEEATYFLRALTDSSYLPPNLPTTFREVAAVLRLANKYDVPYLTSLATTHLTSVYPHTLRAWTHRDDNRTIERAMYLCVAVLNLAREMEGQLECVLPQVLYACADGLSVSEIFGGVEFEGGLLQGKDCSSEARRDKHHSTDDDSTDPQPSNRTHHLAISRADQQTLLRGREELLQAKRTRLYAFLTSLSAGCGAHACREEKLKCFAKVQWDAIVFDENDDFDWRCFEQRVCKRCFTEGRAAFDIAQESLWNELPRFFGLPKWEALRRMQ